MKVDWETIGSNLTGQENLVVSRFRDGNMRFKQSHTILASLPAKICQSHLLTLIACLKYFLNFTQGVMTNFNRSQKDGISLALSIVIFKLHIIFDIVQD